MICKLKNFSWKHLVISFLFRMPAYNFSYTRAIREAKITMQSLRRILIDLLNHAIHGSGSWFFKGKIVQKYEWFIDKMSLLLFLVVYPHTAIYDNFWSLRRQFLGFYKQKYKFWKTYPVLWSTILNFKQGTLVIGPNKHVHILSIVLPLKGGCGTPLSCSNVYIFSNQKTPD